MSARVSCRSILLSTNLLLALDKAFKRMLMFAGKVHHLRRLCLSHFVRINPALGCSFIMSAKHEMPCTFAIHVEEPFHHVYDKIHWSVIVVQEQHTPC
jgi:hypothetical protein